MLRESAVPVQRQGRATAGWTDLPAAWTPALSWDITIRSVTSRSRAIAFLLGAVAEQAVRLFTVMLRQSLDLRELQTQTTGVTVSQGWRPPVSDAPGTDRRPDGICHCIRCNASGLMRGGAMSGCCPKPDRGPSTQGQRMLSHARKVSIRVRRVKWSDALARSRCGVASRPAPAWYASLLVRAYAVAMTVYPSSDTAAVRRLIRIQTLALAVRAQICALREHLVAWRWSTPDALCAVRGCGEFQSSTKAVNLVRSLPKNASGTGCRQRRSTETHQDPCGGAQA